MNRYPTKLIAEFTDRYGETRQIHKKHDGRMAVRQQHTTPSLAMNNAVSSLIGAKIKARRKVVGFTMVELATRCGMGQGSPKQRIFEIENATRDKGVRMGTLYAIALALGCEARDFMPDTEDVAKIAEIRQVAMTMVSK